jgi:O-antigen/teichoic acid export membrane protein
MLLSTLCVLGGLSKIYYSVLLGAGKPQECAKISAVVLLTNVVLNIVFIPERFLGLGASGAALATVLALLAGFVWYKAKTEEICGLVSGRNIAYQLAAGWLAGAVLHIGNSYLHAHPLPKLLTLAPLGLGVYFLALCTCKEFTKKDADFFCELFSAAKMRDYVSAELASSRP